MPGVGKQWVAGGAMDTYTLCNIRCPGYPCLRLPHVATYDWNTTRAGFATPYKGADGTYKLVEFPMKCACAKCVGGDTVGCQAAIWVPSSANCQRTSIKPQGASAGAGLNNTAAANRTGRDYPAAVCSRICRSDEDAEASNGYTGWVDNAVSPAVCRTHPFAAVRESRVLCC